jgi:hypothetical protein
MHGSAGGVERLGYSGFAKTVAEVADFGFCVSRSQTGVSDPGYKE